jgi:hypothetical protein
VPVLLSRVLKYTNLRRVGIPQDLHVPLIYVVKCVERFREAISSPQFDPLSNMR